MATVSVTIDGRTYRMACNEGEEEHLAGLAHQLDQYISHLKSNFGEIGDHRLSVMAGIMVMDELDESRRQFVNLKQENELLRQENAQLTDACQRYENAAAKAVNRAAKQIEDVAGRIMKNRS